MNETNTAVTAQELADFVAAVSEKHNSSLIAEYPGCIHNWGRIELAGVGQKYAKLASVRPTVENDEIVGYGQASAFCFIDLSNGNILKADSWSRPAKHARGNIRRGDASNLWNGAFSGYAGLDVSYLR